MPLFLENLGFDKMFDGDDAPSTEAFYASIVQEGLGIEGYYGIPYLNRHYGDAQFIASLGKEEGDEHFYVDHIDSHMCGNTVWKCRIAVINIDNQENKLAKRIMVNRMDGGGLAAINIVNADVLPSYAPDEIVNLQVVGFPINIKYYPNDEAFDEAQPKNKNGETFALADGVVFPVGLFTNSSKQEKGEEPDDELYDVVQIRGKVKGAYKGYISRKNGPHDKPDEEGQFVGFIKMLIETEFGDLELAHAIDAIPEEDIEIATKPGTVVDCLAVLTADAAINEYEKGIVKNKENNLRALSYAMCYDDPERLASILSNDFRYYSEAANLEISNADEYIERLKYCRENAKEVVPTFATITELKEPYEGNEDELEFGIGERCYLLTYEGEEGYNSIVFIKNDEEDNIKEVYISQNPRYGFRTDAPLPSYDDEEENNPLN